LRRLDFGKTILFKKIVLILTEFPPAIGGMQTHAILLSRYFQKKGHEVEVFTYRAMDDLKETKISDNSFPFTINRKLTRISYFKNLEFLEEAIKKIKPDLIYSSTVFYGILQEKTKIPVICRSVGNDIMRPWIVYPFHIGKNIVSSFFVEKYLYKFFKKIYKPEFLEILFRKKRVELTLNAARSASKILANSCFTERLLFEAGVASEKVSQVVGGVDSAYFKKNGAGAELRIKLGLPLNKKILLTACRLVDKKGVDFLIRSMAYLKDYLLLVVGDGRRMKRLKRLAQELCVNEQVVFIGAVSYQEMPEFYWASDIFVLASTVYQDKTTGLRDAETMGRVLCEANASGLSVIATNSGGIPSVIQHNHNGLLFPENDMQQFLGNINRIQNEKGLREHLVNNGLCAAKEKFDWEHILKTHEENFDGVTKRLAMSQKSCF